MLLKGNRASVCSPGCGAYTWLHDSWSLCGMECCFITNPINIKLIRNQKLFPVHLHPLQHLSHQLCSGIVVQWCPDRFHTPSLTACVINGVPVLVGEASLSLKHEPLLSLSLFFLCSCQKSTYFNCVATDCEKRVFFFLSLTYWWSEGQILFENVSMCPNVHVD